MDNLNKSDILKIRILRQFKEKNIDYTASYMADLMNNKYETVKKALEFYFSLGIVEKEIKEHGDIQYTYYKITDLGNKLLKSEKI